MTNICWLVKAAGTAGPVCGIEETLTTRGVEKNGNGEGIATGVNVSSCDHSGKMSNARQMSSEQTTSIKV